MVVNYYALLIILSNFCSIILCAGIQLLLECIPPDQFDNNSNKTCPETREPVCSVKRSREIILYQIGQEYQNSCLACQDESVQYYFEGSCDQYQSNIRFCNYQALSTENCYQNEYEYACAIFNETRCFRSRKVTYLNACFACKSSKVNMLFLGQCKN